jgi:hypothetical protein
MKNSFTITIVIFFLFISKSSFNQIQINSFNSVLDGKEIKTGEFAEPITIELKGYSYSSKAIYIDSSENYLWIGGKSSLIWRGTPFEIIQLKGKEIKYAKLEKIKGGSYFIDKVNIKENLDFHIQHEKGAKAYSFFGSSFPSGYVNNYMPKPLVKFKKIELSEDFFNGSGKVYSSENLIVHISKNENGKFFLKIQQKQNYNCISGDCDNGTGKLNSPSFSYSGDFKDGKPNGKGVIEMKTSLLKNHPDIKLKYQGDFVAGKIEGTGKVICKYKYSEVTVYEGLFLDGKPNGQGKFDLRAANKEFAAIFGQFWTKNRTHIVQNFPKSMTKISILNFEGNFNGGPSGTGEINIKCQIFGTETIFSGNITIKDGEIQIPYTLIGNSGTKTYKFKMQGEDGEASGQLTLKDNKITTPLELTAGTSKITVNKFTTEKNDNGDQTLILQDTKMVDGDDYLIAKQDENGNITGRFESKTGDEHIIIENWIEGASSKGTEIKNGNTYTGQFKTENGNYFRSGNGKINYSDGRKYEGTFANNKRLKGILTFKDGSFYNGEFENDQFEGTGTYSWATGDKYVGQYKSGERNGIGTYTWPSGNIYKGDWIKDNRTGKGKMTYKSGGYYEGEFYNGEKTGAGFQDFEYSNGRHIGPTVDGNPKGKGKFNFPNGDKYNGEIDGLPNGQGTIVYANGKTKTGRFKSGKYSPYGPCTCEIEETGDGNNITWYKAKLFYSDGDSYIDFKITVKESSSENREYEYWSFQTSQKGYHYRWIWDDITEARLIPPYNKKGQIKTNYKGGGNYEIGFTTDDEIAVTKMLQHIFKGDCSRVTHDY